LDSTLLSPEFTLGGNYLISPFMQIITVEKAKMDDICEEDSISAFAFV